MSIGVNGLVNAGYRGSAKIDGVPLRFTDASISAKQAIDAPDLVMGHWDHNVYNYGKIEVGGSISGPVTEGFLANGVDSILSWGAGRILDCGELTGKDVDLIYYCGYEKKFTNLLVNSLNISVSAGDAVQFALDVVGTGVGEFSSSVDIEPSNPEMEKILTWDKVSVSIGKATQGVSDPFSDGAVSSDLVLDGVNLSSFDFTIANNIETLYSLGQANLFPFELVPGMRTISGSISVYNIPGFDGADRFDDYCAKDYNVITFNLGGGSSGDCPTPGVSISMKVRFHRIEPSLSTGPIISTVAFTGVGPQTGDPWEIPAST